MSSKDLYSILGLSRSATTQEIKKAYHKLAREYHPDRNSSPQAESRFKEIAAAFDVLGNAEKKSLYDEFGPDGLREGFNADAARQWGSGAGFGQGGFGQGGFGQGGSGQGGFGGNFDDILSQLFGGAGGGHGNSGGFGGFDSFTQSRPRRGQDLKTQISIPFGMAITGGSYKIPGHYIDIKIPAGIQCGQKMRLKGKGGVSQGGAGDLHVTVNIDLPTQFYRDSQNENDLCYDLPLRVSQAVLGDKISIPLPEGGSIKLKIPSKLPAKKRIRIPQKGMPQGQARGHLYIMPYITTPNHLPESKQIELEALLKALDAYY
jgi:DnaJ-class molecular chaperone